MFANAYELEQLSRQVVQERLAEAREQRRARLVTLFRREQRRDAERPRDAKPAPVARAA